MERLKSHEYGYGGYCHDFFETNKMCNKVAQDWYHRKLIHFFGTLFCENRTIENCGTHVFLGIKTWKHRGRFIETGDFGFGFNETKSFKFLLKKHVKRPISIDRVSL